MGHYYYYRIKTERERKKIEWQTKRWEIFYFDVALNGTRLDLKII